ncbi:MAG: ATP-binding protein [Cyclobacteriaceae bacterium]
MPVLLNIFRKFDWAQTTYTFLSTIFVLICGWLLGKEVGVQYFFIVLYGYPFIFFKPKHFKKTITFLIYNTSCLIYFELAEPLIPQIQLSPETNDQLQVIVLSVLLIFCAVIITGFYFLVKKNEERLSIKSSELEKAYGMKQEFLSTMSHELRTPLNAVVSITSLLEDSPNQKDSKKLIKLLKFSANNLLSIINDILDFSKLEVSKIQLDNRPHELKKLLREIRDTYKNLADEKGLAIKLNIGEDVSEIYKLDDVKIGQILGNLIGNAIKFTNLGRITIQVSKVSQNGSHDIIRFEIIDTGSGIPEAELASIFESFSQVKSETTRQKDGTGLGLAITKRLLKLYDAEIKVESTVGKGSVFSFEVSLKRGGQIVKIEEEKIDSLLNKTILLVEDNAINAMVAQKLLTSWGIVAIKAMNGQEAIDKCIEVEYDLILMDLHMPIMDGFNAAKHIRNDENINMYTPIFALTADVTGETNSTFNKYFDGFLTKPIQKDKLRKLLVEQFS